MEMAKSMDLGISRKTPKSWYLGYLGDYGIMRIMGMAYP